MTTLFFTFPKCFFFLHNFRQIPVYIPAKFRRAYCILRKNIVYLLCKDVHKSSFSFLRIDVTFCIADYIYKMREKSLDLYTEEALQMRTQKFLSAMLALAIMLSCIGWTPTRAEAATLDNGAGTVTENIQPQTPAEGIDILQSEAAQTHVARLRGEEQENLNQQIFLNQDGSKTMYVYDHPVKYRDEQGEIHDISLDIADTGDAAYPYRTRANSTVTAFPAELSAGITLSGNGVSLRLAAQMPAGSTAGTTELVNHRVQRVDEQKVAYRYDADTTIEYALTYTGFKEDIVVNRYTGQTEYNFILYTDGLTLTQIGGGHYLTDESGEIQASIGQIIVFTADERNNTFGQLVATTIKENQIYGMTIVLDADYLADPETKYPIRIDPTINMSYQYSGTTAIEDTTIHSEGPSDHTLYGLHVGLQQDTGIGRILMKFPGLDFDALGTGVTITNATVYLYDVLQQQEAMEIYYHIYPIAWDAETFSGESDFAAAVGQYLGRKTISYDIGVTLQTPHYYGFNITAAVRGWLDGTYDQDAGIMFKAHAMVESGEAYISKTFASYNNTSNQPMLTVSYTADQYGLDFPSITLSQEQAYIEMGNPLTLTATVESGNSVVWTSSNPNIATVDNGTVTALKAGCVAITATVWDQNGQANEAHCIVYVILPDGVYYIRNCASSYFVTVDEDLSMIVRQNNKTVTYPDYLWQVWRIIHIGNGYYHIRPMAKLDYALQKTNTGINAKYIGDQNTSAIQEAKWSIEYDGCGYIFRNKSNTSQVLCPMSANVENIALDVAYYNSISTSQRWTFIDAPSISQHAVLYNARNGYEIVEGPTIWMGVGETKTLEELGFVPAAISEDSISQDFVWGTDNTAVKVDRETGTITAVGETLMDADVVGRVWYEDGSRVLVWITVCVGPIPNGIYLIENAALRNFMQIDDGDKPDYSTSGAITELFPMDGQSFQQWEITHIEDHFYRIISVKSGLALSVNSKYIDKGDKSLIQEAYSGTDRQIWKIEAQADGLYTIRPKSAAALETDWCMAAGDSLVDNPDGRNVEQRQYISDHDYSDHWQFIPVGAILDVQVQGQQQSHWCWVTVAKMYAEFYDKDSTGTQNSAVRHVYGSALNATGGPLELKRAVEYFLPDDTDAPGIYNCPDGKIYSEERLIDFLDNGYLVCVFRSYYSSTEDVTSRTGGHATLICGYVIVDSKRWFLVKDPSPMFVGSSNLISYEKLCNGRNPQGWETEDKGIWETSAVPFRRYYYDMIDYYFNQEMEE